MDDSILPAHPGKTRRVVLDVLTVAAPTRWHVRGSHRTNLTARSPTNPFEELCAPLCLLRRRRPPDQAEAVRCHRSLCWRPKISAVLPLSASRRSISTARLAVDGLNPPYRSSNLTISTLPFPRPIEVEVGQISFVCRRCHRSSRSKVAALSTALAHTALPQSPTSSVPCEFRRSRRRRYRAAGKGNLPR